MSKQWKRLSETAMRCDPWTVAKVRVRGELRYVLWRDNKPHLIGTYDTFDQAKAEAERMEGEGA